MAAITAIMVIARVFDALNDPIMGNIIESTHTKWGKFKPWLVIGILLYLQYCLHHARYFLLGHDSGIKLRRCSQRPVSLQGNLIVGMSATAFLMTIMAIISVIGYVLMIASRFVPAGIAFWVLVIGYMLSNFGQYCYYLVMMISIINTVEYNEYKTGHRDEAIIASVRPFFTKMSSALIVVITSVSNIIGSVENGQAMGLLICTTILPCVLMLISYFLYQKKYTLDEEEYERICKEIAEKKHIMKGVYKLW